MRWGLCLLLNLRSVFDSMNNRIMEVPVSDSGCKSRANLDSSKQLGFFKVKFTTSGECVAVLIILFKVYLQIYIYLYGCIG